MTVIKYRQRGWHPWKATKIDVLDFIHMKEAVTVYDLMDRFNYTYKGSRKQAIWASLGKAYSALISLFQRGTWGLTELAAKKLEYYKRL